MAVLERTAHASHDSRDGASGDPPALSCVERCTGHDAPAPELQLNLCDKVGIACAVAVIVIGALASLGWISGTYLLASMNAGFIPTPPGSAICLMLLGAGIAGMVKAKRYVRARRFARAMALVVGAIGLLKILELIAGTPLSIEALFVRQPEMFGYVPMGRMSPITTLCFLTMSPCIVWSPALTRRRDAFPGLIASAVFCVGGVILMGYAYGSPLLYGGRVVPVALPTAIGLLAVSAGVIATNGPDAFPLRAFAGTSARALLLRTFVPLTAGAVILFGFLLHLAHIIPNANEALISGLVASVSVLIAIELASFTARSIGERLDRTEAMRLTAVHDLSEARDELEIRVAQRTEELVSANTFLITEIEERERAEAELARARIAEIEIASRVQHLLLGAEPLTVQGIRLAAFSTPSFGLNGDFIDFHHAGPGLMDIVIGDVMGKGLNAALVGAGIRNAITRQFGPMVIADGAPAPERIVEQVRDRTIDQLISLQMFVTLCYARFDVTGRTLTIVDAGHTKAVHHSHRAGNAQLLSGDNLPLGVCPDDLYTSLTVSISPNDRFLFYSDAITEARSPGGEMFGVHRLLDCVRVDKEPEQMIESIRNAVAEFSGSDYFADDFTCIAVQVED